MLGNDVERLLRPQRGMDPWRDPRVKKGLEHTSDAPPPAVA